MLEKRGAILAGLVGGAAGADLSCHSRDTLEPPAGHGTWYPVNVLAAMATHEDVPPTTDRAGILSRRLVHSRAVVHAILSLTFGLAFAIVLPRIPPIPGPLAWGGLLMPLFWTALTYGMMGVVNPVLQKQVDWPWFVASQFVFGIVAAVVIVRSEEVYIPPAGEGPDQIAKFVAH